MNKSKYSFFALVLLVGVLFALSVEAQSVNTSTPNIETFNTATSSTVIITTPSGYKSEVISNYDGSQFHTYATSTPLTSQDIQNIQTNIQKEEVAMKQLFQQQEALFKEQEQMFQNMFSSMNW